MERDMFSYYFKSFSNRRILGNQELAANFIFTVLEKEQCVMSENQRLLLPTPIN
jgi:hypothetical protein